MSIVRVRAAFERDGRRGARIEGGIINAGHKRARC